MKIILPFLFSLILLPNLHAQSKVNFFQGSVEEALKAAKEENKPLFIEAYAVWCGPCKMMMRETFTDPTVAKYFNENFINVKLDVDRGGRTFAYENGIRSIPHFIFMNSDGEKVMEKKGFFAPHLFIKVGQRAFKKATK